MCSVEHLWNGALSLLRRLLDCFYREKAIKPLAIRAGLRFYLRMNPDDITKELQAIAAKRAALKAEQEKMEELERALSIVSSHFQMRDAESSNDQILLPRPTPVASHVAKPKSILPGLVSGQSKSNLIRAVFADYSGEFTSIDVFATLQERGIVEVDKSDVSFALSRMGKSGELKVVKRGAGKTPSTYAKPLPTSESAPISELTNGLPK